MLWEASDEPDVILIGTGSEVHIAMDAAKLLQTEGIAARVVSLPSWELFDAQPEAYRDGVLPPEITARVSIRGGHSAGVGAVRGPRWCGRRGAPLWSIGAGRGDPRELRPDGPARGRGGEGAGGEEPGLTTNFVGLAHPPGNLVVELLYVGDAQHMGVGVGRERFDLVEPVVVDASLQPHGDVQPAGLGHRGGEAHPHHEAHHIAIGKHIDPAAGLHDLAEPIEEGPDVVGLTLEQPVDNVSGAGVYWFLLTN